MTHSEDPNKICMIPTYQNMNMMNKHKALYTLRLATFSNVSTKEKREEMVHMARFPFSFYNELFKIVRILRSPDKRR